MTAFLESTTAQTDMENQPFTWRDLEQGLVGPEVMSPERDLVQFKTHIAQIESLQRMGLTPQQFAQTEILRVALLSAVKCLSLDPSVST